MKVSSVDHPPGSPKKSQKEDQRKSFPCQCDYLFSNQGLLLATTFLFTMFVVAEIIGGLAGMMITISPIHDKCLIRLPLFSK
jgi:hypothetical protein